MKTNREPVRFSTKRHGVTIEATLRYSPSCFNAHAHYGVAYADLIESGIRRVWNTSLTVDERLALAVARYCRENGLSHGAPEPGETYTVRMVLYRDPQHGMLYGDGVLPPVRSIPVRLASSTLLPSRVGSPFWRRGWGIFRRFQLESLGLNWSRRARGRMTMAPYRHIWQIEPVAAHEFGHLMGLGDAYGAIYRYYSAAPGTDNYLMRSNRALSSEELAMVFDAQRENRMQFFPKRFERAQFKAGFQKEIARLKKQLDEAEKKRSKDPSA